MNQQWQVCELEESSNISLTLFERFSVVSVPESWILLLDGILVCFWPKVDPGKKIRSLHNPEDDEECVYYKCRILLDGAKFSTYKEAKQAELIAQNVSSIMDSSVLLRSQNDENICESTMDFAVSDADIEEIDKNADFGCYGFNVTSMDDEKTDDIVGHDSFEYNEAMLKRPYFPKKAMAMVFEIENFADELLPSRINQTTFSDTCDDYNTNFKFDGANFLTSTVIDEVDFSSRIKKAKISDALLTISAVELKLSSFVNDILNDLNKSKEILRQMENGGGSSVHEREETISKKDVVYVADVRSSVTKSNSTENIVDYPHSASKKESVKENEVPISNGSDELNLQRELPLKSQPYVTPVEDIHYDDVSDNIRNINETFVAKPVHISDTLNVQRPEILSIEYIPRTQNVPVDIVPVSHVPAVSITENEPMDVVASVDSQSENVVVPLLSRPASTNSSEVAENIPMDVVATQPKNVIRLPNDSIDDYARNNELLDEDVFEEAMINHLAPLAHENETNYMNRTLLVVFTKNFLLNGVSWKKQANRVNIKHSTLVCCWMESYRKKFDANVDSKKFQEHFRRFKSALRAAKKADLKRKLNPNAKSKKAKI